jgi:hypothetical protein
MDETAVSPPPLERREAFWLWFGVAAGPVVWAVHLFVAYAVQTLSCQWRFLRVPVLGIDGLRLTLLAITAVAVLIILYGGFVASRFWQQWRSDPPEQPEQNRFPFMAYLGLAFSTLFALTTLLTAVPILALNICGPAS